MLDHFTILQERDYNAEIASCLESAEY